MTDNPIIAEDLHLIHSADIDWSYFTNKTILISGASGFLPAYMVEALLFANRIDSALNITVIALVRDLAKAKKRFKCYLTNKALVFLEQDVCDPIVWPGKVDVVIHAASQASPKYYGSDPVGTLSANVMGTKNMLEFAKKHHAAVLYFSSAEIYGHTRDILGGIKENDYGYLDPTNVRSCYAESKRMGENLCVSYSHQFNIQTKILRPFHTFGPGMKLDDGRVFVDFVRDVLNGSNIVIKSDGSAIRAYCYISDAVIAYFKVLINGETARPYNIGNPGNAYSVAELADTLVLLFPLKQLSVVKAGASPGNNYLASTVNRIVPNIDAAKALNWAPTISLGQGFYRTIMSYID